MSVAEIERGRVRGNRRYRQRELRHPHHPFRDWSIGPAGRRRSGRLPRRREHVAVGDHRQQEPQGALRLLPADGRRRGANVCRRAYPRIVLPPRGSAVHRRDPDLPAHRPPAAPVVRRRAAQRDPGRGDDPEPGSQRPVRRAGDQRRVGVHPAERATVLRPHRGCPGRTHRRHLGCLPHRRADRAGRVRHGGGRPDRR